MISNQDINYIIELTMVSNISDKSKRERLIDKVCKKYNKNISEKTLEVIDKKNNINKKIDKYIKDIDYDI